MHLMMKFSHIGGPGISIHSHHPFRFTISEFSCIQDISEQSIHYFLLYRIFSRNRTFLLRQPKIAYTNSCHRFCKFCSAAFTDHFPEIFPLFGIVAILPQHYPVTKISKPETTSHKMLQHMNQQIKSLPRDFICIDFQSLKIDPLTMLTAFLLQLFQRLIQMSFLKIIRPCGMKLHHFFLLRIQDNMMVGMPSFRRMKSIGFQNL